MGTVAASSTTMNGTSTKFLTQLSVNDAILGTDGQLRIVLGITSDTVATLDSTPSPAWSGMVVSRIPALVHYISMTLAGFYLWQRRGTEGETPKDWITRYNQIVGSAQMKGTLDQLADEELLLDNYTSDISPEGSINTDNAQDAINFNDRTGSFGNF